MPRRFSCCLGAILVGLSVAGCADVAGKHVGLSLLDAYAAPGESVRIAACTRRSLGGHVTSVQIDDSPLHEQGMVLLESPDGISSYMQTDSSLSSILRRLFVGDEYCPLTEVSIPIPEGTDTRGKVQVSLRVAYVQAVYDGPGSFRSDSGEEVLSVPVTLVSPGAETFARWRDIAVRGALALMLAAACTALVSWSASRSSFDTSLKLPSLCFLAVGAYGYATLFYASEPLAAIIGWPLTGYRLLLWLVTMLGSLCLVAALRAMIRHTPRTAVLPSSDVVSENRAA